jgi:hypothetical protein
MESDSYRKASVGSVLLIANDRPTSAGQLDAELMLPACLRTKLEQEIGLRSGEQMSACQGAARVRSSIGDNSHTSSGIVEEKGIAQLEFGAFAGENSIPIK